MKQRFLYLFSFLYLPVILRVEKLRATILWRRGVRDCKRMARELNGPRVYLFYDSQHHVFSPMTRGDNRLGKPSIKRLRSMGKMHGANIPSTVEQCKQRSFYYTPSRWGARGCCDNRLRAAKLALWVQYYLYNLSEPMMKCLSFRQAYARRHRQQE